MPNMFDMTLTDNINSVLSRSTFLTEADRIEGLCIRLSQNGLQQTYYLVSRTKFTKQRIQTRLFVGEDEHVCGACELKDSFIDKLKIEIERAIPILDTLAALLGEQRGK